MEQAKEVIDIISEQSQTLAKKQKSSMCSIRVILILTVINFGMILYLKHNQVKIEQNIEMLKQEAATKYLNRE